MPPCAHQFARVRIRQQVRLVRLVLVVLAVPAVALFRAEHSVRVALAVQLHAFASRLSSNSCFPVQTSHTRAQFARVVDVPFFAVTRFKFFLGVGFWGFGRDFGRVLGYLEAFRLLGRFDQVGDGLDSSFAGGGGRFRFRLRFCGGNLLFGGGFLVGGVVLLFHRV